jgi:hypothetical protein
MKATHDRHADVSITFNSQEEGIYSPDGLQRLLPCDCCQARVVWCALNVVSTLCAVCAGEREIEGDETNIDEYYASLKAIHPSNHS